MADATAVPTKESPAPSEAGRGSEDERPDEGADDPMFEGLEEQEEATRAEEAGKKPPKKKAAAPPPEESDEPAEKPDPFDVQEHPTVEKGSESGESPGEGGEEPEEPESPERAAAEGLDAATLDRLRGRAKQSPALAAEIAYAMLGIEGPVANGAAEKSKADADGGDGDEDAIEDFNEILSTKSPNREWAAISRAIQHHMGKEIGKLRQELEGRDEARTADDRKLTKRQVGFQALLQKHPDVRKMVKPMEAYYRERHDALYREAVQSGVPTATAQKVAKAAFDIPHEDVYLIVKGRLAPGVPSAREAATADAVERKKATAAVATNVPNGKSPAGPKPTVKLSEEERAMAKTALAITRRVPRLP